MAIHDETVICRARHLTVKAEHLCHRKPGHQKSHMCSCGLEWGTVQTDGVRPDDQENAGDGVATNHSTQHEPASGRRIDSGDGESAESDNGPGATSPRGESGLGAHAARSDRYKVQALVSKFAAALASYSMCLVEPRSGMSDEEFAAYKAKARAACNNAEKTLRERVASLDHDLAIATAPMGEPEDDISLLSRLEAHDVCRAQRKEIGDLTAQVVSLTECPYHRGTSLSRGLCSICDNDT